jgi:large subunit ribosomal protein L7/L12
MATIDDTITALETKLKQAKSKKQKIEARKKAAEQKTTRANDTRRKILVGVVVLNQFDSGVLPKEQLMAMMDKALSRTDDRALFDLPPKE